MKRVVLAGGSGFVGRQIKAHLQSLGYEVLVLSRGPKAQVGWDGRTVGAWASVLEGAEAVINLSGEPVAQKWTIQAQQGIVSSRVDSTRAIGQAILQCAQPPKRWINASAVGIYGDRGDEVLTETSAPGDKASFLVDCCLQWEAAQDEFELPSTIKSKVRIGFVCGHDGGGFPVLTKLAKSFAGGAVGNGNQYMSWIHEHDLVRLFTWLVETEFVGTYNGTAPTPESNQDFMAQLRRQLGRPWAPPAPAFALKLASAFGAPDPDVLLMSQRAVPEAALKSGFTFEFPDLESAFKNLCP